MNNTVYEDGKYCVQDVGTLYLGTKYTLGEILEEEEIPFKFRLLLERYILPEAHPEDTLETHLYYLDPKIFLTKIYRQLKARVRINILKEKTYTTKTLTLEEFAAMPVEEKESRGVVIQELLISKLALMVF